VLTFKFRVKNFFELQDKSHKVIKLMTKSKISGLLEKERNMRMCRYDIMFQNKNSTIVNFTAVNYFIACLLFKESTI